MLPCGSACCKGICMDTAKSNGTLWGNGLWHRFILTGFYAAKLDWNTHVWIYTSHRCSFLHDSTIVYNDNSNKWRQRKEENARRAAGHSRVLFTGCRSLFQASFFQIYCHLSHYIREVEMRGTFLFFQRPRFVLSIFVFVRFLSDLFDLPSTASKLCLYARKLYKMCL